MIKIHTSTKNFAKKQIGKLMEQCDIKLDDIYICVNEMYLEDKQTIFTTDERKRIYNEMVEQAKIIYNL